MKKLLLGLALGLTLLTTFPTTTFAATPSFVLPKVKADAIPFYLKFQHEVRVYFAPLLSVKSTSYTLEYKSNRIPQGVTGSFTPGKKIIVVRDIPLETCSANTCIMHTNLSDMKLTVITEYKDNSTDTKTYNVHIY